MPPTSLFRHISSLPTSVAFPVIVRQCPAHTAAPRSCNAALKSLIDSRRLGDARRLFDRMPAPDSVSWTTIISAYVAASDAPEALLLFSRARSSRPPPTLDPFLLSAALKACASTHPPRLRLARPVHALAVRCGLDRSVFVATALLRVYSKAGLLPLALQVFDEMPTRNTVSWTAAMAALAQAGRHAEALRLFSGMRQSHVPWDSHALATTLKACVGTHAGREIHALAVTLGFDSTPFVATNLSTFYINSGKYMMGLAAFARLRTPDVVSWTAVIAALAWRPEFEHRSVGIGMFVQMLREGSTRPNDYTFAAAISAATELSSTSPMASQLHSLAIRMGLIGSLSVSNAMITSYSTAGHIHSATLVFGDMEIRDAITWSAIVTGYARAGLVEDAFRRFSESRTSGVDTADEYVLSSLLSACSRMATLDPGRQLHAHALVTGFEVDSMVGNGLVNMYAKCGSLEDAQEIFGDGEAVCNVVSWTSMINAYADHGNSDQAIKLFARMPEAGLSPDAATFVGVLNACCAAGLVELGLGYFNAMRESFGIHPEKQHYSCVVDLLCHAGRLAEAECMIKNLPCRFLDDHVVWSILLRACRMRGDVDRGKRATEKLLESQNHNRGATLVTLSNLYASKGHWGDVASVRALMRSEGVLKEPGSSWIAVGNHVSVFVSGDRKHPTNNDIFNMLDCLLLGMQMEVYAPVLHLYLSEELVVNMVN